MESRCGVTRSKCVENCLGKRLWNYRPKYVIKENIEGMERRGKRRKQLLDNLGGREVTVN